MYCGSVQLSRPHHGHDICNKRKPPPAAAAAAVAAAVRETRTP